MTSSLYQAARMRWRVSGSNRGLCGIMHTQRFKGSGGGGVREWWYLPWGAGMGGGFVAIGLLGAVIQRLELTCPNTFRMLGILASRPAPEVSPFVHTGRTIPVLWLCQAAPSQLVPGGCDGDGWRRCRQWQQWHHGRQPQQPLIPPAWWVGSVTWTGWGRASDARHCFGKTAICGHLQGHPPTRMWRCRRL